MKKLIAIAFVGAAMFIGGCTTCPFSGGNQVCKPGCTTPCDVKGKACLPGCTNPCCKPAVSDQWTPVQ